MCRFCLFEDQRKNLLRSICEIRIIPVSRHPMLPPEEVVQQQLFTPRLLQNDATQFPNERRWRSGRELRNAPPPKEGPQLPSFCVDGGDCQIYAWVGHFRWTRRVGYPGNVPTCVARRDATDALKAFFCTQVRVVCWGLTSRIYL